MGSALCLGAGFDKRLAAARESRAMVGKRNLFQTLGALVALLAAVLLMNTQAVSGHHAIAQAGQLQAGEVVLCTVNGPMKVMVGADGIPTQAPVDTADGGGCEFCGSASVSIAFAISVLGLWQSESDDSPRARTADARFITPPDKRHAPAQAPPALS